MTADIGYGSVHYSSDSDCDSPSPSTLRLRVVTSGQPFNWDILIPITVHPVKVAIIEALQWIRVPLSPKEIDLMFGEECGVSLVSYHMRTLADAGVVEMVRQQSVRGAVQSFYALAAREPASPSLHCE